MFLEQITFLNLNDTNLKKNKAYRIMWNDNIPYSYAA